MKPLLNSLSILISIAMVTPFLSYVNLVGPGQLGSIVSTANFPISLGSSYGIETVNLNPLVE